MLNTRRIIVISGTIGENRFEIEEKRFFSRTSLELKLEIDESTRVGRVTERGNLGGQLNRLAVANAN